MLTSGSAAYELDQDAKIIKHPEKGEFRVGPQEFRLLSFLHANPGKIFNCQQLLEAVWDFPNDLHDDDLVRMTIHNLRRRVAPNIIDTVPYYGYGVGLKLVPIQAKIKDKG